MICRIAGNVLKFRHSPLFTGFPAMAANNGGSAFHTESGGLEKYEEQKTSSPIMNGPVLVPKGHLRTGEGLSYRATFHLKESCLLVLHRGDLTQWTADGESDAIVNAANTRMLGGGGVDGAIHRAAGPDLYIACLELPVLERNVRCRTGDAVITEGFRLPVSKIIHTVGPIYLSDDVSAPLLESSYKSSFVLAVNNGIQYLAFPAISCGTYGYPYDKAAEIALKTVRKFSDKLKEVHFVLFEEGAWLEWLEKSSKEFNRVTTK
ncbi:hypothetical protein KP509_17G016900 [Ceratopteris richardii]|uniref:Macro domain-containing protein n=1 Tax=Ceratopteris richardii TaxID=49495 RepID=A0A8T2STZ8_CERRI|nr:hypothetical protein KP509_17G016900 [Ceratopteris richardii]KAH7372694.1 hypothetical protein KP509_17G016900 [Ceratopteris richardii]